MQYHVLFDGVEAFDLADTGKCLISPKVEQEIDGAGKFTFVMPPTHVLAGTIVPYATTIEVKEREHTIFIGSALPPKKDILNRQSWTCEGALAWLNNVVLPPDAQPNPETEKDSSTYVQEIIDYYNSKVSASRQIGIAALPQSGTNLVVREWKGQTCFDAIKDEMDTIGGVLFTRMYDGDTMPMIRLVHLDDYMAGLTTINQPVELRKNIVDLNMSGNTFYTAVIGRDRDRESTVEEMLTDAVAQYGYICAYKEFSGSANDEQLRNACRSWLAMQAVGGVQVDIDAIDLRIVDAGYERYDIARKVLVRGVPWGIGDVEMPITKVTYALDSGKKSIRLGNRGKQLSDWLFPKVDVLAVRPDAVAYLCDGDTFFRKSHAMVREADPSIPHVNRFIRSTWLPSDFVPTDFNIVSTPESPVPIYLFMYTSSIMAFYSDADTIVCGESLYSFLEQFYYMSDISACKYFDVSRTKNFARAFALMNSAVSLDPIANWDVGNGIDFSWMFDRTRVYDLTPLSNWNVSNVINFSYMFYREGANNDTSLQPLSNWDVSNGHNFIQMFNHNRITDISPLGNWNPHNATTMRGMFNQVNGLVDASPLDSWGTRMNTQDLDADRMFSYCPDLMITPSWGLWDENGHYTPATSGRG